MAPLLFICPKTSRQAPGQRRIGDVLRKEPSPRGLRIMLINGPAGAAFHSMRLDSSSSPTQIGGDGKPLVSGHTAYRAVLGATRCPRTAEAGT
jgi:hypothetical protein